MDACYNVCVCIFFWWLRASSLSCVHQLIKHALSILPKKLKRKYFFKKLYVFKLMLRTYYLPLLSFFHRNNPIIIFKYQKASKEFYFLVEKEKWKDHFEFYKKSRHCHEIRNKVSSNIWRSISHDKPWLYNVSGAITNNFY